MTETREILGQAPASSTGMLGSVQLNSEKHRLQAPKNGSHVPSRIQDPRSICPQCGSHEVRKSGKAWLADGSKVQRLRCLNCNYRFRIERAKKIKSLDALDEDHQVCVPLIRVKGGTKNLDSAAIENTPAAGVTLPFSDNKSELLAYTWTMQKAGYASETVRGNTGALKALIKRGVELADPESVKAALALEQSWSPCRRRNVINAYTLLLKFHGIKWDPPRCNVTRKFPFIPVEQEINDLIAGCPCQIATFLQVLKETAMRAGEAKRLKWIDVDLERHVITLNDPEKGSLPRIFNKVSGKLLGMLESQRKDSELVFGERSLNSFKAVFYRARQRIAFKLANPRLLKIHFHTLRHWKATMEYHRTKDILHVKEFLGHKEIDNTLVYISLDKKLFQNIPDDSFITRIAHDAQQACELIETGFEYVTGEYSDGGKIFRRRK